MITREKEKGLIFSFEQRIHNEVSEKELWGDLDFSLSDYEQLRTYIQETLLNEKLSILRFAEKYPLSLTTFMVFLARFKYNTNFWALMGEELGISINPNHQSELGALIKRTFSRYGFDFSDCSDDHWTNLAPIFYEAGIPPESCFDDLFFILSYDNHTLFDPQLIIDDLLEKRSYQIRKPMEKFLKRFKGDRAIEFVIGVHDAMLCADRRMQDTSNFVANYLSWKERQRSRDVISSRKKQEYQAKPYLCFDNTGKGLCVVLPRAIMRDEWIDKVVWRITDDHDIEIKKHLSVVGDEGSRYISSIAIPVYPSQTYIITLTDSDMMEDSDILSWTITGISNDSAVLFNSDGRLISASYLAHPYGIMILGDNSKLTNTHHVEVVDRIYPTTRPEYRIIELTPNASDASLGFLRSGAEITLRTKPQINLNFVGDTLFSLPTEECNLFSEVPKLRISVDENADVSGLEIRVDGKCKPIDTMFDRGIALLPLKSMCHGTFVRYGTYSIKLYQYNRFLKQAEFCYVPIIRSDYSPNICWADVKNKSEKIFTFAKDPEYSLVFENCTVISDEESYTVHCNPNSAKFSVHIHSNSEDDSFGGSVMLPVKPIDCSVMDLSEDEDSQECFGVQKYGLEDIQNRNYWLHVETFHEYKNYDYTVILRNANGIEQKERLALTHNGSANLNLSVFRDTLSTCLLPARLELCCNYNFDEGIHLLIINDGVGLKHRPQYLPSGKIAVSVEDDEKNLTLKRFGAQGREAYLPYSSSSINSKGNGILYPSPEILPNGLYSIECSKTESVFEFEDDAGVIPSNGNDTIYITSRRYGTPINCFSDWLDELIQIILRAGTSHNLSAVPEYKNLASPKLINNKNIDVSDYEKLLALAYFAADPKCLRTKINSIRSIMRNISCFVLDSSSRIELLRILADLKCHKTAFDICVEYYSLYLFEKNTPDARLLSDRIENSSPELSLLLRMGCEDRMRNIQARLKEVVGKDALRSLITVPGENNNDAIAAEIKRFFREQPGSCVYIELTKEISGDMYPITEMIVYPELSTRTAYLDISKKPDVGIYFGHIKYIDQYINWYRMNHDRFGNINDDTSEKMISAVKDNAERIKSGIRAIKHDPDVSNVATRYERAIKARFDSDPVSNLNSPNPHRFFYLQAMAALIVMLPSMYRKPAWNVTACEQFISSALAVAPMMSRRDILMAGTFIYFVRKEEKLCQ